MRRSSEKRFNLVRLAFCLCMTAKDMKERREGIGYSLGQIAKALGVPKATYANWERGSKPGPGMMEKLSATFNRLEGSSFLQTPIKPSTYKAIAKRAKEEGKTTEEMAGEILRQIFGLLIFAAIISAAILLTSPDLSEKVSRFTTSLEQAVEPKPVENDIFWGE